MTHQQSIHLNSFVGRGRELSHIDAALADALTGHGRLVLVSGEPGIGNTRLADEASRHAANLGLNVFWGRCWEGGGAPPYWPLIQVIRSLVARNEFAPAISSVSRENLLRVASLVSEVCANDGSRIENKSRASDAAQARFKLFDSVASLLRACARTLPLFLLIDDLHDSDQSSLQMLSFIARGLTDSRVAWLSTYRDAEVRRSSELSKHIAELHREGSTLPLGGLSGEEIAEFVESRAGRKPDEAIVKRLHSVTDGNPLFIDGVVRLMLAEGGLGREQTTSEGFKIPEGVRGSIRRQLGALSERTNAILEIAAVIGIEFESDLLRSVCASGSDDLARQIEPAITAGIVANRPGGSFRFAHALIRDSIYTEINSARRVELHAKIGEAIESLYGEHLKPHVGELAHHFEAAGNIGKAIDYSVRSGRASFRVFAYEEARSHWENALAMFDRHNRGDTAQRASILWLLTDDQVVGLDKGIEYSEAALALYEQLGDEKGAVQAHSRLAGLLSRTSWDDQRTKREFGGRRQAVEHFRKAETQVARLEDPVAAVHFWIGKALICFDTDQIDAGMAAAQRLMEISDQAGDPNLAWPYGAAYLAKFLAARGRIPEAESLVKSALDKSDPINNTMLSGTVALMGGDIYIPIGAQREAQVWYGRELLQPRSAKSELRPLLQAGLANSLGFTGDMREARRQAAEVGYPVPMLSFWEGDWAAADEVISASLAAAHANGGHSGERQCASGLAWINRIWGDYSRARIFGERVVALAKEVGHITQELFSGGELALTLGAAGLTSEALPHLERCREILASGANWYGMNHVVSFAEAVVASKRDLDLAEEHFERSVENYRRFELVWRESDVFYYWGRALLEAGREARAVEKFDAALEIYRRIEAAQTWVDRVMTLRERCAVRAVKPHGRARDSEAVFRKEGEFWTISYDDGTFRLKDAKGLHYIAYLLSHPGEKFRVHDLIAMVEGPPDQSQSSRRSARELEISGDLGDVGPILDDKAKGDYRRRKQELREELDEAETMNDAGRVERALAEIEMLEQQLSAAIGLGGRDRKASSHAERARVLVTRNIRTILGKIEEEHPPLGRHFNAAIKTGYLCTYIPAPESAIAWKL
jgi:tetratricopeptide (TPR) repeat protein